MNRIYWYRRIQRQSLQPIKRERFYINSSAKNICQTNFSESVTEPLKAAETAYRRKLDVLCITDHNTIQGASADGEILALFIHEGIKPMLGAPLTIDLIHERGGIAVAAHPFSPQCHSLGKKIHYLELDGVENGKIISTDFM